MILGSRTVGHLARVFLLVTGQVLSKMGRSGILKNLKILNGPYSVGDSWSELGPKSRANDLRDSLQIHFNCEQSLIWYNNNLKSVDKDWVWHLLIQRTLQKIEMAFNSREICLFLEEYQLLLDQWLAPVFSSHQLVLLLWVNQLDRPLSFGSYVDLWQPYPRFAILNLDLLWKSLVENIVIACEHIMNW